MKFPDATPAPAAISVLLEADPARPFVIAQLGQSLDGRIATPTGESRWINRGQALDHLHAIRAAVDAVVVGVGTIVADNPRLNVRRVELSEGRQQPARVVLDPRGRVPVEALCLNPETGGAPLVVTGPSVSLAGPTEILPLPLCDGAFRPGDVVSALYRRGFKRLLIEGGAHTISSFIDAGTVDRLHLLVAPLLLGSGTTGLSLASIDKIDEAMRPLTTIYSFTDGDVLFDCDLRSQH